MHCRRLFVSAACWAMRSAVDYLENGLALVLLLPGPLLHERIQQQLAHMDDGQAGICSGLLH